MTLSTHYYLVPTEGGSSKDYWNLHRSVGLGRIAVGLGPCTRTYGARLYVASIPSAYLEYRARLYVVSTRNSYLELVYKFYE